MTRTCATCAQPIGVKNASGLCRGCVSRRNATDPAFQAARLAGIRRKLSDPVYRAEHIARCIANGTNISDEVRRARSERGKANVAHLRAANAAISPETRKANGRTRSDTVLAWCPPEWRDKYRDLKSKGRRAPVAKRIILDLIAGRPEPVMYAQQKAKLAWCPPARRAEYKRARSYYGAAEARRMIEADMSPFERQMAKVAAGARVVAKPMIRTADHSFTLGGVASGML